MRKRRGYFRILARIAVHRLYSALPAPTDAVQLMRCGTDAAPPQMLPAIASYLPLLDQEESSALLAPALADRGHPPARDPPLQNCHRPETTRSLTKARATNLNR
jgi:hypothetical protein